jgi:hypothetical protein
MKDTQTMLDELIDRLKAVAGENLESVILYGSGSTAGAQDRYSDLNLVCILRDAAGAELARIAPVVDWWTSKVGERPPMVFTLEELRASADVFAIELLDMKAQHRVLAGNDVLTAIDVPMNLHRIEVEHDLRTLYLRLRQHYLLSPGNGRELQRALAKSVSSTVTLLRHALIVLGECMALGSGKRDVIARAHEVFQVDVAPFLTALELREDSKVRKDVGDICQAYLQSLAAITRRVDEAVPKRQWQKTVS